MEDLLKLAKVLRAAQVVAHTAHNNAQGPSFFSDHAFLGETYAAYEDAYDSVVERYIGLTQEPVAGVEVMREAMELISDIDCGSVNACYESLLVLEKTVCKVCTVACGQDGISEGTKQLVGEICNVSEMRQYKIRQRIA